MHDLHIYMQIDEDGCLRRHGSIRSRILAICDIEECRPCDLEVGLISLESFGYRKDLPLCVQHRETADRTLEAYNEDPQGYGYQLVCWSQSSTTCDALLSHIALMFED